MFTDTYGNAEWWEWALAIGILIVGAAGAIFTGGASFAGAGLIRATLTAFNAAWYKLIPSLLRQGFQEGF